MPRNLRGGAPAPGGSSADDLREWRWRSYLDHLEDLGYDLGTGERNDEPMPVGPGSPEAQASASRPLR